MNYFFGMPLRRLLIVSGMMLLLLGSFILPFLQSARAQVGINAVPGELLIKIKPNATPLAVRDMLTRMQAQALERVDNYGWIRVRVPTRQINEQILQHVRQFPQVQAVEPNFIVQAIGIPNDPSFKSLWGLHNTGQTGGTAGADIDAPEGWDKFTPAGNRVVVAVIDTGVDYTHPDLNSRIWVNADEVAGNGVDDDRNGFVDDVRGWDFVNNDSDPMDDHNHGTHVSGTIAATFNNGVGVAGVAGPADVRIMPLKFLNSSGSGSTSNAIKALDYATANGAVVSNNSWGGGSFSQALADALQRNHQAGRLFVAAAGNNSRDTDSSPYYPQGYDVPNVISVASTTSSDTLSSFSNYGSRTVDLGAPGSSIYSTVRGGYSSFSGTSMATPHVVGGIALIWAKNHTLTNLQVKQILMDSTRKVGYLGGKTVTGGMLNLNNAMAATPSPGSPAPSPPPEPTPPPSDPTPPPPMPPIAVPAAPTGLTATPVLEKRTHYSIRYAKLSWKDNASNEIGYEIWQSDYPDKNFRRIKLLGANATSWTHQITRRDMTSDSYYKVRAYNGSGASAFSNLVKVNRF